MRSTLVVLSLAALGLLVYYGGFVVGPKIQAGVEANAKAAAQSVDGRVQVKLHALDAELTGLVASEEDREQVKRRVAQTQGVRKVVDKLEVAQTLVEPTPVKVEAPVVVDEPVVVDAADVAVAAMEADVVDGDVAAEDDAVAMDDDAVVDEDVVGPEDVAVEDDAVAAEDVVAEEEVVEAAAPPAPAMLELKWDGSTVRVEGAGSKALVGALNEMMLRDFVAEDLIGEVAETEAVAPVGFDAAAKTLTGLLAGAKSGSFRIEDKLLKLDVVVADAAAKTKFMQMLNRVPRTFKREVNVAIAPPPEPVVDEPVVIDEPVVAAPAETPKPAETPVTDPGGALTEAQCQALINAAIDGPDKRFTFTRPNSSRLTPEGIAKANEVAALLKRCPDTRGAIDGFHHNQGDPDEIRTLTRKRAFSVHAALVAAGVDAKRFVYRGMGYNFPKYPNKLETRHLNERVEIKLGVD